MKQSNALSVSSSLRLSSSILPGASLGFFMLVLHIIWLMISLILSRFSTSSSTTVMAANGTSMSLVLVPLWPQVSLYQRFIVFPIIVIECNLYQSTSWYWLSFSLLLYCHVEQDLHTKQLIETGRMLGLWYVVETLHIPDVAASSVDLSSFNLGIKSSEFSLCHSRLFHISSSRIQNSISIGI